MRVKQFGKRLIGTATVCLAILVLIFTEYRLNWTWNWTGFDKTLWDWMQLLIIPAALSLSATWFNRSEHKHDQKIALDNQRATILKDYLAKMSELLLEKDLRTSKDGDEVRKLARAWTLTTLRELDGDRKRSLLQFLNESDLIRNKGGETIIDMHGADLSKANLHHVYLRNVDLSGADLCNANLFSAKLDQTNFCGACLCRANLRLAELTRTDLSETHVDEANFSDTEMTAANLKDAHAYRANFSNALMDCQVILDGANLSEANLTGAYLLDTDLTGATLDGANLCRASVDSDKIELDELTLFGVNLNGIDINDVTRVNTIGTTPHLNKAKSNNIIRNSQKFMKQLSKLPHELFVKKVRH